MNIDKKRRNLFKLISFPTFILFVGIVLGIHYLTYLYLMNKFPTWEERAHYGEMFGITHSLFDGLAFVALLFTILLQQSEITGQKDETKKNLIVQKTLVEVLGITAQLNAQYSLLDLKNRIYDRSIEAKIPAANLIEEERNIKQIETNILNTIDELKNMLDGFKITEVEQELLSLNE